jgi:hypothetical protein
MGRLLLGCPMSSAQFRSSRRRSRAADHRRWAATLLPRKQTLSTRRGVRRECRGWHIRSAVDITVIRENMGVVSVRGRIAFPRSGFRVGYRIIERVGN